MTEPAIPTPALLPRIVTGDGPPRLVNVAGGERPLCVADLLELMAYTACELRYTRIDPIVVPAFGLPALPRNHALTLIEECARALRSLQPPA